MGSKHDRRYRNLLLDARFQLKYATLIALLGGLVFGAMAFLFYDQVRENSELVALDEAVSAPLRAPPSVGPKITVQREALSGQEGALAPVAESFETEMAGRLAGEDSPVLWTLISFWAALVLCLFLVGILVTHRVAGPVYVIDQQVRRMLEGKPVTVRALRRGDEFQGLLARVVQLSHVQCARGQSVADAIHAVRARADALGDGQVSGHELSSWLEAELAQVESAAVMEPTVPPKGIAPPNA